MSESCPACRSGRFRPAMTAAGFRLRRCRECGSLWVENPPDRGATDDLYRGEAYFVNPDFAPPEQGVFHGYKDYLADRRRVESKFAEILEHLERFVPPGRLLDVGCGPGFLLTTAASRGWRVQGVDLNDWAVKFAREHLGLDVRRATLESAGFEDESFDAVMMMDLVEHVAAPEELLREAARVTRQGGALVVLTPDAGSPVSRMLRGRWPEVQRAPEHLVLLSLDGAVRLLERCGWEAVGWHSVGKTSSLETLLADVAPAAPTLSAAAARVLPESIKDRELELDPRTKLVLYANKRRTCRGGRPPRLPKRLRSERETERAVLEELHELARAARLCDWMFEQFEDHVRGDVVEVGAGIGTFSRRVLAKGARTVLLIEPEDACAAELERRFGADERVTVTREPLPEAPTLAARAGAIDFVLCQNVLEHVEDHAAATEAMARALRPGGVLTVLVPALPRLFGSLDVVYGHWRRYTPSLLRALLEDTGLEVARMYYFNALGIPGWWLKNRTGSTGIGSTALAAYEATVVPWRALERRVDPPLGLSLVAHARRR